jgi:hypothetical protein
MYTKTGNVLFSFLDSFSLHMQWMICCGLCYRCGVPKGRAGVGIWLPSLVKNQTADSRIQRICLEYGERGLLYFNNTFCGQLTILSDLYSLPMITAAAGGIRFRHS